MSTSILIVQLAVLAVVLESDVGRRAISWFRILRPVVTVVIIVPFFFTSLPTSTPDLLLQGAGIVAGALLGLGSVAPWFVRVGFDPHFRSRQARRHGTDPAGRPVAVSRAGWGYAAIWIGVTLLRIGFTYSAQNAFPQQLGVFLASNHLSTAALTNAFIFLSVGMDLFRSAGLVVRGRRARRRAGRDDASGGERSHGGQALRVTGPSRTGVALRSATRVAVGHVLGRVAGRLQRINRRRPRQQVWRTRVRHACVRHACVQHSRYGPGSAG